MNKTLPLVIATLVLLPLSHAGTAANPEVTDASGDTVDPYTGAPADGPSSDIVSAWFGAADGTFQVTWRVRDLRAPAMGEALQYNLRWEHEGERFSATAQRFSNGAYGDVQPERGGGGYPSTSDGTASVTFNDAADTIRLDAKRAFGLTGVFDSTAYRFEAGDVFASPRAQAWSGSGLAGSPVVFSLVDEAGPGRAFTFDAVASGNGPFDPIAVDSVTVDGQVLTHGERTLTDADVTFTVGNQPKSLTYREARVALDTGDVVTLKGFTGELSVASGRVKFMGSAAGVAVR